MTELSIHEKQSINGGVAWRFWGKVANIFLESWEAGRKAYHEDRGCTHD